MTACAGTHIAHVIAAGSISRSCDGPATEALNVYQVKEVERRMQRDRQVLTHQRRCLRHIFNKLAWILALVLSVVWCAHAQQTDDVPTQIQQLKEQYERTTRELDRTRSANGQYDSWLRKFTTALQIGAGCRFFSRPVLRLFVTYASWSNSLRGYVGGIPFRDQTSGLTFGVQTETCW